MTNKKPTIKVYALGQPFAAFEARQWRPSYNLYQAEGGVILLVDLAGTGPANLHLHVDATHVVVHGTRRLTLPADIRRIEQMEIGAGPFQLDVPLSRPIDPEKVAAHYDDGLLEVKLPFAEQPGQRVIVIKIEGGRQ